MSHFMCMASQCGKPATHNVGAACYCRPHAADRLLTKCENAVKLGEIPIVKKL